MRIKWAIIVLAFLIAGCSSEPAANNSIDMVSDPGVTQPPPPDANTIIGDNPRDPKSRKPREVNPPGPPSVLSESRPAPEDSEMSAMMNEDGSITEIRTFKSHPQLDRVEARWTDPLSKDVKIFLINGQVRSAKTDKLPQLSEAKTEQILNVAGVKPSNK